MNIKEFDNKKLFNLIKKKLEDKFGNLPEEGVIAGQSIASAFYEVIGLVDEGKGVYNDIDIFCDNREKEKIKFMEERRVFSEFITSLRVYIETKSKKDAYFLSGNLVDTNSKDLNFRTYKINNRKVSIFELYMAIKKKIPEINNPEYLSYSNENINENLDKVFNEVQNYLKIKSILSDNFKFKNPLRKVQKKILNVSQTSLSTNSEVVAKNGYFVNSSEMCPYNKNHNYIMYSMFSNEKLLPEEKICEIINSFDLNMCQIGLDLKSQKISWTENFEDFVNTKKISCVYHGTPIHTPVRLIKKLKEFEGFSSDLDKEFLKLKTLIKFSQMLENINQTNYTKGLLFSEIYKERFENRKELHPHFDLIDKKVALPPPENTVVDFYSLDVKGDYCEKSIKKFSEIISNIQIEFKKRHPDAIFTIQFSELVSSFSKYYDLISNNTRKNKQKLRFLDEATEHIKSEITMTYALNLTFEKNVSSLNGKSLPALFKAFNKHPIMMSYFQDLLPEDVLLVSKRVRWLEKNDLEHILGIGENVFDGENVRKALTIQNQDEFKKEIKKIDDKYKEDLKKEKKPPLFDDKELNSIEDGFFITEINTKYLAFIEGKKMRHCVGGYWNAIKDNKSIIFNIKNKTSQSTVEYRFENGEFKLIQHQSKFNRPPDHAHNILEKKLRYYLNSEKIKNVFQNKISDNIEKKERVYRENIF